MTECFTAPIGRRKTFWTTQPCGTRLSCGNECATFGLRFNRADECGAACDNTTPLGCSKPVDQIERTIDTTNSIVSLALNILLTNGRKPDATCGYRPGQRGGHWSDSFRDDGMTAGSLLRTLPATASIRDSVQLARGYAQADLSKLVTLGYAQSVDVQTAYLGGNAMSLDATIFGQSGLTSNVGITGSRSNNSWLWG